ncbi:MAG: polyprenyl synthetase family protein [Gemmatimonadetes bacterium]|nr:polyprenyl synthetase family protein [Gemmatimonadota bacterium]
MTEATFVGLRAYLDAEVRRVEAALLRAVAAFEAEGLLGGEGLAAIRHGVLSGGKRLRPVLCVAAFRACDGDASHDPSTLYDLAVSLELIHAYSLMHDDLPCMDDAELRRGRPTTHREHGEAVTMTAAAALIPLAARQALDAGERLGLANVDARTVARCLMEAAGAGGMVGGQWLDLLGEGEAVGAEALGDLHRRKTGALLSAALVMGAMAAGADAERVQAMRTYGTAIGLAFQIADDILDATASADALGKNPSDTHLDKSTYVALYGLEGSRARGRAQVDLALGALAEAGITSEPLEALALYVVERDR